jgi:hypothetical protein
MMASDQRKADKALSIAWWALLAVTVVIVIVVRIRLLEIPLERDEGEYAYAGQLMLQGIPPYKLAYNMKFPGTYAAYALFMSIFGQTIAGVHLGLLLMNGLTIALMFFLARRLTNPAGGIAAASSYAVLSIMPYLLGPAGHATHFVVCLVVAGLLLLLRALDRGLRALLFASGTLFGLALLMKQPAIFFVLFGLAFLIYRDWQARLSHGQIFHRAAIFVGGVILPLALTVFLLWRSGVIDKFWFWTVVYAREYGTIFSPLQGVRIFFHVLPDVIRAIWALWAFAALGLVACLYDKNLRANIVFLVGFLSSSLFALSMGFFFRQHYFILLLPVLSLFISSAIALTTELPDRSRVVVKAISFALFAGALGLPIFWERDFFFELPLPQACRLLYGTNPFVESIPIADYLRAHTTEGDTITVLGSEPQIYFYSQRHSATGYIYTYSLMESHQYARQMQREMIQEIEQARPKYLVLVLVYRSWLLRGDSDKFIFDWANKYCDDNYEPVGLVNINEQGSEFFLSELPKSPALSPDHIWIYKRKG